MDVQAKIEERIREIAKGKGFSQNNINPRPEFEGYRLARLILETSND